MLTTGFAGLEGELTRPEEVHPVWRIGEPAKGAALVLFLISEAAGFMTGAEFALDGG